MSSTREVYGTTGWADGDGANYRTWGYYEDSDMWWCGYGVGVDAYGHGDKDLDD